jgi:hypothetical protein
VMPARPKQKSELWQGRAGSCACIIMPDLIALPDCSMLQAHKGGHALLGFDASIGAAWRTVSFGDFSV